MLNTAKAESVVRVLKDHLVLRGFAVVESNITNGKKLVMDTDAISIRIVAMDGVSKDIFGNTSYAFTPHEVKLAIKDATAYLDVVKVMIELNKHGFALKVGNAAALVDAETAADAAEAQEYSALWPTRGA